MKRVEEIKSFINAKLEEAKFKVGYASELFNKLNLSETGLGSLADDIAENKGVIKAYGVLIEFIDSFPKETVVPQINITKTEEDLPFSFKVFTARKRFGENQKEFSKRIGCEQSSISKWEQGAWKPSARFIKKVEGLYEKSKEIPCLQDLRRD